MYLSDQKNIDPCVFKIILYYFEIWPALGPAATQKRDGEAAAISPHVLLPGAAGALRHHVRHRRGHRARPQGSALCPSGRTRTLNDRYHDINRIFLADGASFFVEFIFHFTRL
jgi:hypothetical protein